MPTSNKTAKMVVHGARAAADEAARTGGGQVSLPLIGRVQLPPPDHLAWYAGVGLLAVLDLVDWPVALIISAGKMLADSRRTATLREFGDALESAG